MAPVAECRVTVTTPTGDEALSLNMSTEQTIAAVKDALEFPPECIRLLSGSEDAADAEPLARYLKDDDRAALDFTMVVLSAEQVFRTLPLEFPRAAFRVVRSDRRPGRRRGYHELGIKKIWEKLRTPKWRAWHLRDPVSANELYRCFHRGSFVDIGDFLETIAYWWSLQDWKRYFAARACEDSDDPDREAGDIDVREQCMLWWARWQGFYGTMGGWLAGERDENQGDPCVLPILAASLGRQLTGQQVWEVARACLEGQLFLATRVVAICCAARLAESCPGALLELMINELVIEAAETLEYPSGETAPIGGGSGSRRRRAVLEVLGADGGPFGACSLEATQVLLYAWCEDESPEVWELAASILAKHCWNNNPDLSKKARQGLQ